MTEIEDLCHTIMVAVKVMEEQLCRAKSSHGYQHPPTQTSPQTNKEDHVHAEGQPPNEDETNIALGGSDMEDNVDKTVNTFTKTSNLRREPDRPASFTDYIRSLESPTVKIINLDDEIMTQGGSANYRRSARRNVIRFLSCAC